MNVYLEVLNSNYEIGEEGLLNTGKKILGTIGRAIMGTINWLIQKITSTIRVFTGLFKKAGNASNSSSNISDNSQSRVRNNTSTRESDQSSKVPQARNDELTAEIEELKRSKKEALEKLKSEYDDELNAMKRELSAANAKNETLNRQRSDLQKMIDDYKTESVKLQKSFDDKIKKANSDLAHAKKHADYLVNQIRSKDEFNNKFMIQTIRPSALKNLVDEMIKASQKAAQLFQTMNGCTAKIMKEKELSKDDFYKKYGPDISTVRTMNEELAELSKFKDNKDARKLFIHLCGLQYDANMWRSVTGSHKPPAELMVVVKSLNSIRVQLETLRKFIVAELTEPVTKNEGIRLGLSIIGNSINTAKSSIANIIVELDID